MSRIVATAIVAIIGIILSGTVSEPPATLAHEHRTVAENYVFVIGWLDEPALAYEPNGLSLRITHFPNGVPEEESEESEAEGQPVEGLEETLQAEIVAGGGAQTRELTLEPVFNDPGHYESVIIPTVPGDYTFHVFGQVQDIEVDESFTSGPETFSVIEEVKELQFPEELPSNSELEASLNDSGRGGDSDTATILAIIGIAAGVIGIGVGALAMAQRRA